MSRVNSFFVAAAVVLLVVGFATNSRADTILLNYNFDSLTTGALAGQDSWYQGGSGYSPTTPGTSRWNVATGATGWTGNYAEFSTANNATGRHQWTNTLQNNLSFDVSVLVRAAGSSYLDYVTLFWASTPDAVASDSYLSFGINNSSGLYWQWNDAHTTWVANTHLTAPTTDSVVKVGFTFTSTGGDSWSVQPYYQNITASGAVTNATASPFTVTNFRPGTTGTYYGSAYLNNAWNEYQIVGSTTGARIDNLLITQVATPEPSMLALLGMGLAGLLAYAWRKRR